MRLLHNKVGFGEFVIGLLCVLLAVLVLGGDKVLVGLLIVPPMLFLLFAFPYVIIRRLMMFWNWLRRSSRTKVAEESSPRSVGGIPSQPSERGES